MSVTTLNRQFRFDGIDLPDPESSMTPEQVLAHYSKQHPRLLGGKVVPPVVEGDKHVYELRASLSFGEKG